MAGHDEAGQRMPSPNDVKLEGKRWGFYNRVNRVPYYQRLFQQHDGVRQWNRGRSRYFLTPYYVVQYFTIGGVMYMMCRSVLGHKTWFGKN